MLIGAFQCWCAIDSHFNIYKNGDGFLGTFAKIKYPFSIPIPDSLL